MTPPGLFGVNEAPPGGSPTAGHRVTAGKVAGRPSMGLVPGPAGMRRPAGRPLRGTPT